MSTTARILQFFLFMLLSLPVAGQQIKGEYITTGTLKDPHGNEIGEVGATIFSGSYGIPIYTKYDAGKINSWRGTISGKYASYTKKGAASSCVPDEIVNAGAMLTNIRSISSRWTLVATAGISLNALPSYIRRQCIALTGGGIFMYKVNKGLNVGIGAIVTTTYGEPVIMPVPFITWKYEGKYSIELNMEGMPKLVLSMQPCENTKISFIPFGMQQLSAVININGDNKLYSENNMLSSINASYKLTKNLSIEANAGYIYHHRIEYKERSFKGFWNNLFNDNDKYRISSAATLSVGLKYNL